MTKVLAGVCAGLTLAWFLIAFTEPRPRPQLAKILPLKNYNIVLLPSGEKVPVKGNFITAAGFCSMVWKNGVVDTIICPTHILTEADEQEPLASPQAPAERRF